MNFFWKVIIVAAMLAIIFATLAATAPDVANDIVNFFDPGNPR